MTIMEMLGQSAMLIVLGVGIVFSFLLLVVIVVSQFVWIFKPRGSKAEPTALSASPPVGKTNNTQVIAAIAAAITEYRKQEKN